MFRTIVLAVAATVMIFASLAALFMAGLVDDPDEWRSRLGFGFSVLVFWGLSATFFYLAAHP